MKRKNALLAVLAAAAIVVALLAGCSAAAPPGSNEAAPAASAAPAEPATDTSAAAGTQGGSVPVIQTGEIAAGSKIIFTVTMTLEAKDAAAAINDIENETMAVGGYIASSEFSQARSDAASTVTVRIPPEKLGDFTAHVGTLGKVLGYRKTSQDVTAQYTDTQSRLTNAQAQEAQLLDIMNKCTTVSDTLKVRDELNTVQQEIEQDKGELKLMDNQVGYSTVTVTIQQPPKPAVVVEKTDDNGVKFWGFAAVWQKVSRGFVSGFNWTLNALSVLLMVLAYVILPLAVAGGITIGIIALVRAIKRRKKKKV